MQVMARTELGRVARVCSQSEVLPAPEGAEITTRSGWEPAREEAEETLEVAPARAEPEAEAELPPGDGAGEGEGAASARAAG